MFGLTIIKKSVLNEKEAQISKLKDDLCHADNNLAYLKGVNLCLEGTLDKCYVRGAKGRIEKYKKD